MAKDALDEVSTRLDSGNSSMPIPDQQKVPPLRIVLNSSSNQKGSSSQAKTTSTQSDRTRDKAQSNRPDDGPKAEGVRIKFASTTKQSAKLVNQSKSGSDELQKSKSTSTETKPETKEDTSTLSHLRRITRRSQKTAQINLTEDEESVSSMTSIDENQSTTQTNNCDSESIADGQTSVTNTTTTTTNSGTNATISTIDAPRKYKRRKYDSAESVTTDYESFFNQVSYRPLAQNSIELFKNIRKQVESKLQNLRCIQPRTPHGFRDYMLTRGAYLLDGNKLGNGLNLCMNEQGGLNVAPIAKYYAYKHGRVKYSVPDRAKVPLGLQINSPLYNLFIDQEKERYRMRIQHIKEREKLTLVTEQEIIRVYNRAAMAASDQLEAFSACTMLWHQEIYDYNDSEVQIQESENAKSNEELKQEGVRTRRGGTHNRCSTQSSRQTSKTSQVPDAKKDKPMQVDQTTESQDLPGDKVHDSGTSPAKDEETDKTSKGPDGIKTGPVDEDSKVDAFEKDPKGLEDTSPDDEDKSSEKLSIVANDESNTGSLKPKEPVKEPSSDDAKAPEERTNQESSGAETAEASNMEVSDEVKPDKDAEKDSSDSSDSKTSDEVSIDGKQPEENKDTFREPEEKEDKKTTETTEEKPALSEADRKVFDKELFLARLQEIDDKWDRIRREMMIRHKNEADSLHAIQKLEWEWKSKEIGACDVRTTPLIDNCLVPRLTIFPQDY